MEVIVDHLFLNVINNQEIHVVMGKISMKKYSVCQVLQWQMNKFTKGTDCTEDDPNLTNLAKMFTF